MRVTTSIRLALSTAVMTFALVATAQATSVRTFVASTGNDANTASNCPRTSPCRNLSAAFGVTTAGGEIVALDAAGYGTLTINKAITILGVDGALIAVPSNGTGISITAGATDIVILRNIQISGAGASNTTGVQLNAGKLVVQSSSFRALSIGLHVVSSKATVAESEFFANTVAVQTTGTGYDAQNIGQPSAVGPTLVLFARGVVSYNGTAFKMVNPGTRPSPATDNLTTIFLQITSNTSAAVETVVTLNTVITAGSGTGCGGSNCQNIGQYGFGTNF